MQLCDLSKIPFLSKKNFHLGSFILVYTPKTFETFCGVMCFLHSSGQCYVDFAGLGKCKLHFETSTKLD